MKRYPDEVNKMYELVLEFTEDMQNLLEQLQQKEEKLFIKINALMESVGVTVPDVDAGELAEQALESGVPHPDAPAAPEKPPRYFEEKTGQWTEQRPVNCGELF